MHIIVFINEDSDISLMSIDDKVCFVSPKIYHYLKPNESSRAGGAERQQYLIAKELRNKGYSVSFIAAEYEQPGYEKIQGFDVWKTIPQSDKTLWRLQGLLQGLRQADADVIYVRGIIPMGIITAIYSLLQDKRFVFAMANDANVSPSHLQKMNVIWRILYPHALRVADQVVAQTEHQNQLLRDNFDINSRVVPNGYEIPPESAVLDHEEREFVLWVGNINREQKRPDRLLVVAEKLPHVQFKIIGPPGSDNNYNQEIRETASELPNVQYEGFVRPDQIDKYYQQAVLLANTSEYEGFPNTFLEAWRFATPVVSLHFDLDETLRKNNIGIRSGSMEQLASDIESLWTDTSHRREMGATARQYVAETFSLEETVSKLEDILIGDNN